MNIAAHAALTLFETLARTGGVDARYVRGNRSIDLRAVPDKALLMVDEGDGARIEAVSTDFLIRASDLRLGALVDPVCAPTEGDRISYEGPGRVRLTFEVATPPFDPHDACGVLLRVHTRKVG